MKEEYEMKKVYESYCDCVSNAVNAGISEKSSVKDLCEFMDGWFDKHFRCNPRQDMKDKVASMVKEIKK